MRVAPNAIHALESKQFFTLDGEHIGLVSASQLLELGDFSADRDELSVVVIGAGQRRYGLAVDSIVGEQSLVVQSLETIFGKLRDIHMPPAYLMTAHRC